jgi:hypothetical protein
MEHKAMTNVNLKYENNDRDYFGGRRFSMINAISILKRSYYWRAPFIAMQRIIFTKLAFINYTYGGIWNWISRKVRMFALGNSKIADSVHSSLSRYYC